MADDPSQFAWPFQWATAPDGTLTVAEIPQDSPADLDASAAVTVCTRRGDNPDDPTFGISEIAFQQGAIDTTRLAAEIRQADDRLDLTATETFDALDRMSRSIAVNVQTT